LYPNPSTGIFYFVESQNIKTVEVYTLLGEKIMSLTSPKNINLSSYAKGIYYAKINGTAVSKLVKE
jgi:hypothetical protein